MKPTSIRLRSGTLDTIRGLTLVSMIVYHAAGIWSISTVLTGAGTGPSGLGSGSRASAVRLFSSPASAGRWGAILCAGG